MLSWIRNFFAKPVHIPEAQIWSIIEGPTLAEDLDEDEIYDLDLEDGNVRLVLKIAVGRDVFDIEAWFENLEDTNQIVNHFNTSIEPLPLNMKDYELVK